MRHINVKMAPWLALSVLGLCSVNAASALNLTLKDNPKLQNLHSDVKKVREARGQKPFGASVLNNEMTPNSRIATRSAVDDPELTFSGIRKFDYLEGQDGSIWYYTAEYDVEYDRVSEWYTEEYIKGFTFTIYDPYFKEVGKISDTLPLKEGETKVVFAFLDPAISSNFFNNDDNLEVMVYVATNTDATHNFEVHYTNKVYSLGGQKDAQGNDVCIGEIPGRCVDTFNPDNGSNDHFFTFVEDVYPNPDDFGFNEYLDYLNAAKTVLTTYHNGNGAFPQPAFQTDIFMTRAPGDTTDGVYFISKSVNGQPYFILSQYEKPYFVDPTGYASDESATPDNNLVIEVYVYSGEALELVTTTKIPVVIPVMEGQVPYAFYSIGSVDWKNDVDIQVNGTPQAPAFIVARDVTTAANLETVESSYAIYGNDGNLIKNLAENTDGIAVLSSQDGDQPQVMFVYLNDDESYTFKFVNLYSGETVMTLDQDNDGDPISAVCQRVKGADGKYHYAFEMVYDLIDENDFEFKRVAWFDSEGKPERQDLINMGKGVMFAAVNMYAECLRPDLYDKDENMEYAVLVKRSVGQTTRTEFLIADHDGNWYAHFTEDDGKGAPYLFSIIPGEPDYLQMMYIDDSYNYNVDLYALPFTRAAQAGIDQIVSGTDGSGINYRYDGTTLWAEGCAIEVFTTSGIKAGAAQSSFTMGNLTGGIYIVRITSPEGKVAVVKISK